MSSEAQAACVYRTDVSCLWSAMNPQDSGDLSFWPEPCPRVVSRDSFYPGPGHSVSGTVSGLCLSLVGDSPAPGSAGTEWQNQLDRGAAGRSCPGGVTALSKPGRGAPQPRPEVAVPPHCSLCSCPLSLVFTCQVFSITGSWLKFSLVLSIIRAATHVSWKSPC